MVRAFLLGRVDTDKHNTTEIYNELLSVGGLSFAPSVIPKFKDDTVYYPKFVVTCSTLTDNLASATNVISELINNSKLDNKVQLKTLVKSMKEGLARYTANSPSSVLDSKIQSYLSPLGRYNETVSSLVFNKENLVVGVTIDTEQYNKCLKYSNYSKK